MIAGNMESGPALEKMYKMPSAISLSGLRRTWSLTQKMLLWLYKCGSVVRDERFRMPPPIISTYDDVADNTTKYPCDPQRPIPDPRLWVIVYAPTFDLFDAYNRNYAQMNQVDANGASIIWLRPKYIEGIGTSPHYSKVRTQNMTLKDRTFTFLADLSVDTSANGNLACDLSGDWTQACYTTLLITISSMQRITEVRTMALGWTVCCSAPLTMLCD